MAHTDYTARGLGLPFCPTARLLSAIGALDTSATMTGYTSPIAEGIRVGMAAMIGSEIVVVEARSGNTLTLGRGTCDTIPAPHAADTPIFFFDDSVGTDDRQYVATESIGVKPLPRTTSGGPLAVENSPPEGLTFNWRFHRPYPPGNVLVNGSPFTTVASLGYETGNLVLTWAHRDRIVQMDQLVKHGEASVGPEGGTTYRVRVIRASDDAILRTADLGSVDTWSYTFAEAIADFGLSADVIPAYLTLESRRDSLSSWQAYRINISVLASILRESDLLDVGYTVAGVGFETIDIGYSILESDHSTVDVGYEVDSEAPAISDPIILRFEGSEGQRTGIVNEGDAGGTFSMSTACTLRAEAVFEGTRGARQVAIADSTHQLFTLQPTTLLYTTGTPMSIEARVQIPAGQDPAIANNLLILNFSSQLAGDTNLMPRFYITCSAGWDDDDRVMQMEFRGRGVIAPVARVGGVYGAPQVLVGNFIHVAMSLDETGLYRAFFNGVNVTEFTETDTSTPGVERRARLIAFNGASSAGGILYLDNVRLRYGFAYTSDFTPDTSI